MDPELRGLDKLVHDFYQQFGYDFWLAQAEEMKEKALVGIAQEMG